MYKIVLYSSFEILFGKRPPWSPCSFLHSKGAFLHSFGTNAILDTLKSEKTNGEDAKPVRKNAPCEEVHVNHRLAIHIQGQNPQQACHVPVDNRSPLVLHLQLFHRLRNSSRVQ